MEAVNYITRFTKWLYIIIPSAAALTVTYLAFKKSLSQNEGDIEDANNKIRNTIKGAILAFSINSFISVIKYIYTVAK